MNVITGLYRHSVVPVAIYILAAAFAFWPRYFADLGAVSSAAVHAHGILMGAWLLMLFGQGLLIRAGWRALHGRLGRVSYALAPAVALSIGLAAHVSLNRSSLSELRLAQLALQLGYLPLFLGIYGLAMRFRRDPARHARFMMCTVLPMTSPVLDRVPGFYLLPHLRFLPQFVDGSRLLPMIYVALAALAVWDWRAHRRADVFPVVLTFFLLQHATVLLVYRTDGWRSFAVWFAGLPIS